MFPHLSRQKGGVNMRGMGEKQIELDRRGNRRRVPTGGARAPPRPQSQPALQAGQVRPDVPP